MNKNAFARALCEIPRGGLCKLYLNYLRNFHRIQGEFAFPEVIYHSKEHVAAVSLKTDSGFQIYFRSIENEPEFLNLLPKGELLELTKAEALILEKIFLKKSNREIAKDLFVSLATVKSHIAHLYQKLPQLKNWRHRNSPSDTRGALEPDLP